MEKKTKKELLSIIDEHDKNLLLYKSRLHDIIGSYKNLLAEKETLQNTIKALTDASNITEVVTPESEETKNSSEEKNDECIQLLKTNLGALAIEKSRIENELKADRKKILQQKEELERKLVNEENVWFVEKQKLENQIIELKKKINLQQKEREKEQQDHVLMLKELQNIVASERTLKEKLENQNSEMHQKLGEKISEQKIKEYEETVADIQHKLRISQDCLNVSYAESKKKNILIQEMQGEIEKLKMHYQNKIDEEKRRADVAEQKLEMLVFVKEKQISNLENRISELSSMVGDHDKIKQQDQFTIQKLKTRVSQLQIENSTLSHISTDDTKLLQFRDLSISSENSMVKNDPEIDSKEMLKKGNLHSHCQAEILQIKNELEEYKIKCEAALKEKFNKTSAALLSDAKAGKEIKELKSRIGDLESQLESFKLKIKLNEEYHSKVTFNLEKTCEDLKILHKQEMTQIEISHKGQLLEFEQQIQKQRERTLLLLEEKDKEINILKTSFLPSFIKKEKQPDNGEENSKLLSTNTETVANVLSQSLITSKNDGHILHYIQELARKDVEISNLRQSRIQLESSLRQLQQSLSTIKENYFEEIDCLQSRIKLLESTQDKEGTNVEYLKNVVLRFLKCSDRSSKKHMINAIATVLHFTNSETQDIKNYI